MRRPGSLRCSVVVAVALMADGFDAREIFSLRTVSGRIADIRGRAVRASCNRCWRRGRNRPGHCVSKSAHLVVIAHSRRDPSVRAAGRTGDTHRIRCPRTAWSSGGCAAARAAEACSRGRAAKGTSPCASRTADQSHPCARTAPTDAVKHLRQRFSEADYILFFLCELLE